MIVIVYLADCKNYTSFRCATDNMCLPGYKKCNGIADCPSGDDENDCS